MTTITKRIAPALLVLALLFGPFFLGAASAQGELPPVPDPLGFVSDYCGSCTPEQLQLLNGKLEALERDTGAEVAVVTVNSCGGDGKRYRGEMFNQWGIGKKGSDNGLLILVCLDEGTLEQETGLRMEGVIPDILAFNAGQEYFLPLATDGKICEGLIALVDYYDPIIRGDTYVHAEPSSPVTETTEQAFPWGTVFLVLLVAVLFVGLVFLLNSGDGGTTTEWYPTTPQTHTYTRTRTATTYTAPRYNAPSTPTRSVNFGGGKSIGGGATVRFGKK